MVGKIPDQKNKNKKNRKKKRKGKHLFQNKAHVK